MSRRGPRCVFLDRLPGTLTVGEFVHVKEVIGPDRQKNKDGVKETSLERTD